VLATQNVLDPRRLGKQNSGFSDDDIANIICLLLPYSDGARAELREMALRTSPHMVDADEAAHPDLQAVEGQSLMPHLVGEHALVLRLSAPVKDPLQGFTFGRNNTRCDVCFHNDPMRRLSNIHFRIYVNEYGVLMLEDSSINGTVVDGTLLKARLGDRPKTGEKKLPKRRTINPGSKIQILMHEGQDDLDFIVQIPRREGDYEETYRRNLTRYMKRLQQLRADNEPADASKTITAGPGGHVSPKKLVLVFLWPANKPQLDLFPVNETKQPTQRARRQVRLPEDPTQEDMGRLPKEWNGSNRYNRVERIGKGAFATVYKVTAKFDGKPYAAKELDKRKFMKNGVLDQKVENEMRIMQRVKHVSFERRALPSITPLVLTAVAEYRRVH
jgi:pSer/pThr/pTyr-binding forkhead associated (FHA) protein